MSGFTVVLLLSVFWNAEAAPALGTSAATPDWRRDGRVFISAVVIPSLLNTAGAVSYTHLTLPTIYSV